MRKIRVDIDIVDQTTIFCIFVDEKLFAKIDTLGDASILIKDVSGKCQVIDAKTTIILESIGEEDYVRITQGDKEGDFSKIMIETGTERTGVEKSYTLMTKETYIINYSVEDLVKCFYRDKRLVFEL